MTAEKLIPDRIKMIDLGLLIDGSTLVISDTHIGYEESLASQGMLVPAFQLKDLKERLIAVLSKAKPKHIIINGDVKHEFGTISAQEWKDTLQIIDLLSRRCDVTLVKGNHDTILGPIADKRDIRIVDNVRIDDIFITHGHRIEDLPRDIRTIIIGHEHPAIALESNSRKEKYKCFLTGEHNGRQLIVMPSSNLVTEGTDILNDNLLSPYLKDKALDFEVFIIPPWDGAVKDPMYFGNAQTLQRQMS